MKKKRPFKKLSLQQLKKMASHNDWKIRETAGFELRGRVEENYRYMLRVLDEWLADKNERVRRAAVLACMMRKKKATSNAIAALLNRLERALNDKSSYVRKCTGPFVLGYLGYTYPSISLPKIRNWYRENKNGPKYICWNLASTFSQALGRRKPQVAANLLRLIINHPEKLVQRAVQRSLINVASTSIGKEEVIKLCNELLSNADNEIAKTVLKRLGSNLSL